MNKININITKKPRKIDIKYIAKIAGVSPATVSRSLRRDPAANKKTIERIIKIARELNYFPDSLAKGLREKRTRTVGIILNDLNNPFYTEILRVIGEILNSKNYSMFLNYSNWDLEKEHKNIINLLSRRVDGIIISPVNDRSENINIISESDVEMVLIDCYPYFKNTSYVYTKHGKGAVISTEYLIKNGHKDILLFTGPLETALAKQFQNRYKQTLEDHDIKVNEELIVQADELSIKGGYETFKNILTRNKINSHFTAIIAISDLLAIGIYKAANELGLEIPGHYSLIGYDDIEVASALKPPLTTIHQPRIRIGANSTRILLNNIENPDKKIIEKVVFDPHLVIRGSVRNIN